MKYPFVIKDEHTIPADGSPISKMLGIFEVFVEFDSWYRNEARLPGQPDITRRGDNYIDVQVDDSVACETIVPILDRLGYKPAPPSRQ